jgi:hypothetical protein
LNEKAIDRLIGADQRTDIGVAAAGGRRAIGGADHYASGTAAKSQVPETAADRPGRAGSANKVPTRQRVKAARSLSEFALRGLHPQGGAGMAAHKFAVGQTVRFSPDRQQLHSGQGWFKIIRLLPEAASVLQYRVKSELDGHERVVREDQLALS